MVIEKNTTALASVTIGTYVNIRPNVFLVLSKFTLSSLLSICSQFFSRNGSLNLSDFFYDALKIVRKWRSRIFYHLALYEQGGQKWGKRGGRILILDFDFVIWFSCQEWKIIIISSSNPITPYLTKFLFWSYALVESDSRILLNAISQ